MTEHPYPTRRQRCELCGTDSDDVSLTIVCFLEPDADGRVYGWLPRCRDRRACAERVAAIGDEPLVLA